VPIDLALAQAVAIVVLTLAVLQADRSALAASSTTGRTWSTGSGNPAEMEQF
jgi:hypothetical protein